jgi:hypothetical protein
LYVSRTLPRSFTLNLTTHFAAPGAPDEFSFFLTNADNTGTLVHTDDPTGADALFIVDIDGSGLGALTIFTPSASGVSYTIQPVQQSVPEPGAIGLLAGISLFGSMCLLRRSTHR